MNDKPFCVMVTYGPRNEADLAEFENVEDAEAAVAAWNAMSAADDVTYHGHAFIVGTTDPTE